MIHATGVDSGTDAAHAEVTARCARDQAARAMARAALSSVDAALYRRTWPADDTVCAAAVADAGDAPQGACEAWADSTLDLREGLCVVEVFDADYPCAAPHAPAALAAR